MLKTQNRVLSKDEIAKVVKYHHFWRRRKSPGIQLRFAIFRLSCCCGLRCKEIAGLNLGDFFFDSAAPFIRIRKDITKGHRNKRTGEVVRKPRKVSLLIDSGTRNDLKAWHEFRMSQSGGDLMAPFICGQVSQAFGIRQENVGKRLQRNQVASMWRTSIRCLGVDRMRSTGIHSGRHTCLTHLAADPRFSLAYVKQFAGHANIATTSEYLHACVDARIQAELFDPREKDTSQGKIDDLLALLCLEAGEISEGECAKKLGIKRIEVRQYRHDLIREYLVAKKPLSVPAAG